MKAKARRKERPVTELEQASARLEEQRRQLWQATATIRVAQAAAAATSLVNGGLTQNQASDIEETLRLVAGVLEQVSGALEPEVLLGGEVSS